MDDDDDDRPTKKKALLLLVGTQYFPFQKVRTVYFCVFSFDNKVFFEIEAYSTKIYRDISYTVLPRK